MIPLSVYVADTNISNITGIGILRWSLQPFIDILGPMAMPMIFLLPVLIIWTNIPTHKPLIVAAYMLSVGFVCFQLFDPGVAIFFQFIVVALTAPIFYFALFKRGPYE